MDVRRDHPSKELLSAHFVRLPWIECILRMVHLKNMDIAERAFFIYHSMDAIVVKLVLFVLFL